MRTFNINDVYIDELLNTSKLPDIFKYRCIIRNNDILNEQFLNELARKINVTPSNLEIYHNWFLINDKYILGLSSLTSSNPKVLINLI